MQIDSIRVGDLVSSGISGINRVVGVEAVPLGKRKLHAINDGRAFFTQEHPFLTLDGWCAVNPLASHAEALGLNVGALTPGDVMICATEGPLIVGNTALAPDLSHSHLLLTRLEAVSGDEDTIVYNLLLDGDHTYVANGFVVHNKDGDGGGGEGGEGGDSGSDGSDSGGSGSDGSGGSGGEGGEGGDADGEGGEGLDDSASSGNDDGTPDQGSGDAPGTPGSEQRP